MFDTTRLAVIVCDAKGSVVWLNRSTEQLTGYSFQDMVGKKPGHVLQGPASSKDTIGYIRNQLSEKEQVHCEIINYNKNKEEYWTELNIVPISSNGDGVELYISMQREITKRKVLEELVSDQLFELRESLDYGRRIQAAVLPDPNLLPHGLAEWMVLYQPKDTLSGDFYWVEARDGHLMMAVADATGHGAPGALMATMGISLLNQALLNTASFRTDAILNALNKRLSHTLNKGREGVRVHDTIDMALVRVNTLTNSIEFSGAKRPIVIVGPSGLRIEPGCKNSVGDFTENDKPFTATTLQVGPEDTVYLFSDGITDQFNDAGKKLSRRHILDFILEIHSRPLSEQKLAIEKFLAHWQGRQAQLDDRILMAFRLKQLT